MLRVTDLSIQFGSSQILNRINFEVKQGEILGIIGPNGSGKSTLLNVLSGVYRASEGSIRWKGKEIGQLAIEERARLGIGRTFQNLRLFKRMTVMENLLVPAIQIGQNKKEAVTKAGQLLELVKLSHLQEEQAQNLSIGQQRLLEFIRTIMLDSELIFLDEPTAGLHPVMIQTFVDSLRQLHQQGKTFVFIEHNIPVVMEICTRVMAISAGEVLTTGDPEAVRTHQEVVESYLG